MGPLALVFAVGAVLCTIAFVGQALKGSLPKTSFFTQVIFLAGMYLYMAIGLVAEKRPARTLEIIASILVLIGGVGELLYFLLHKR